MNGWTKFWYGFMTWAADNVIPPALFIAFLGLVAFLIYAIVDATVLS